MAKPDVDLHLLQARLSEHFSGIEGLSQLAEGEESRAFAFAAAEGAMVVRVNARAAGFEKDRLAFQRFAGPDLPIPEVLLIAPIDFGGFVCVSRRLPGETLQALPNGGAYAYGGAVGRVLDALAARDAAPLSDTPWPDFVTGIAGWDWDRLLPDRSKALVRDVVAEICRMGPLLPDRRGQVHGDFGSNNVLVSGGEITGLLDWSEAMAGDPLYDLANILFWRPWLDCMEQQCRYFETEEPERLAAQDRLTCYQLRIGLQTLRDALANNDQPVANWALNRCAAILPGP